MVESNAEIRCGVKTFFVGPNASLMAEDFLEEFFMNGYETYFLENEQNIRLEKKIDILFVFFEKIILFFNVDFKIPGISWPVFIKKIQDKYKERALIGVIYLKKNQDESRRLERLYLYDIGILCGCIQLGYNRNTNLQILKTVLLVNQANGQRKSIRAICNSLCKMDMLYKGKNCYGVLRDISISHFSCVFPNGDPDFQQGVRINDLILNLHGIHCNVNVVLALKRSVNDRIIHVFVFVDPNGREGLDPINKLKVNKFVYKQLSVEVNNTLAKAYLEYSSQKEQSNQKE